MSNAMSISQSRWKGALLATVAASVLTPLAAKAQSMSIGIFANPLGGTGSNLYSGVSNVYTDPYHTDTLYVYATVTGTQAPSPTYVDGLDYAYFNVNAVTTGAAGLGTITAAVPAGNFSGGSFTQTSGNTAPGAGAQGGLITAPSSTPGVVVGSTTNIGNIAKARASSDFFYSSPTSSGINEVVSGNSVSFLVETITYTPNSSAVVANPSAAGAVNSIAFNVSIPAVSAFGPYTGANYFVGLPSTPAAGSSPGAANTSTGYTASATTINLNSALPGDANLDGLVNGTDLAIENSALNTSGITGGYPAGDLNNDGLVNGTDLAIVNSNLNTSLQGTSGAPAISFQPTALIGGSGAVPEPTGLALLSMGGLTLLRRRRSQV